MTNLSELHDSPLFKPTTVYRPFEYPWAVDATVEHEKMHWTEHEVVMTDDATQWKNGKLSEAEKEFITQILRLFTQADLNVGGFYTDQLMPVIHNNQVRGMFRSFVNREDTHQRAYSLLNETLGFPESEYAAFAEYKEMADKNDFMLEADTSTAEGLALALAKGVCNEGISLFASFVMLLNLQRFGKMKGMCTIVEWSIKDETKHVEGVARVFRALCNEVPEIVSDEFKRKIYDMMRRTVELEDAFVDLAFGSLDGKMEGLTAEEVKQYIRYITDRRLTQLGLKPNYLIKENPLPWLDWVIGAADHTNFFEKKSTEYEVGGLTGDWGWDDEEEGEVTDPEWTVFGRENCDFCTAAKELFGKLGISYNYVDLTDNDYRQKFYDDMGFVGDDRRVPKIYKTEIVPAVSEGEEVPLVTERLIGGYTQLENYMREEGLLKENV